MAGPALAYEYRYRHASGLEATTAGANLRLATSSDRGEPHPHFFQGRLRRPERAADLLRGLVNVVQSRFYLPPAAVAQFLGQADPVVTGSGEILRFEAFSSCCSTYGRIDLLPESIDGTWYGRGRRMLTSTRRCAPHCQSRDSNDVGLAVGSDEVSLSRDGESVVERKVALPIRWLKGFVEVQAYQARMVRKLEVSGFEAALFLRSLPKGSATTSGWVVSSGREVATQAEIRRQGIRAGGVQRLHVLDDLPPSGRSRTASIVRNWNQGGIPPRQPGLQPSQAVSSTGWQCRLPADGIEGKSVGWPWPALRRRFPAFEDFQESWNRRSSSTTL